MNFARFVNTKSHLTYEIVSKIFLCRTDTSSDISWSFTKGLYSQCVIVFQQTLFKTHTSIPGAVETSRTSRIVSWDMCDMSTNIPIRFISLIRI